MYLLDRRVTAGSLHVLGGMDDGRSDRFRHHCAQFCNPQPSPNSCRGGGPGLIGLGRTNDYDMVVSQPPGRSARAARHLALGVVRRAHQRPGLHVLEPQRQRLLPQLVELLGR